MAENTISKYYKNNTVKENDPYGFARFAKGNVQRVQQLTSAGTDLSAAKTAKESPGTDTFNLRSNTTRQTVQPSKKGIDVYKQAGSSLKRTPTLNTLNSNKSLSLNMLEGLSKTSMKLAVDAYRNTAFSGNKKSGALSKGSALLTGSSTNPLSGGLMSSAKLAVPANKNSGGALMKQGITQYKSFDPKKQNEKNELMDDTESFIDSKVKNSEKRETL